MGNIKIAVNNLKDFWLGKEVVILDDTDCLDGGARRFNAYVSDIDKCNSVITLRYDGYAIFTSDNISIICEQTFKRV